MTTVQTLMAGLGVDPSVKPTVDLKSNGSDPATLGRQSNMVKQLTRMMMAAKNASSLTDTSGVACNAAGTSASQQVACAMNAMARVMTGAAATDQAKAAVVLAALNAQNVTTAYMPIIRADGTLDVEMADMTSSQAMQTAMGRAGMDTTAASGTVSGMMQRMH